MTDHIELRDARACEKLALIYGEQNADLIRRAISKFPRFAEYDHARVLGDAIRVYGDHRGAIHKAVLKYPPFCGLDHARVMRDAITVYGADQSEAIRNAILWHPAFAGLDHARVVQDASRVYGKRNVALIHKAILSHPQFADLDHTRVLRVACTVYGSDQSAAIRDIILRFPRFAWRNHARLLSNKLRLASMLGVSDRKMKELLLAKPTLAAYSHARDLAWVEIAKDLKEHHPGATTEMIADLVLRNMFSSPFLPGTKLPMSAAGSCETLPVVLGQLHRRLARLM